MTTLLIIDASKNNQSNRMHSTINTSRFLEPKQQRPSKKNLRKKQYKCDKIKHSKQNRNL